MILQNIIIASPLTTTDFSIDITEPKKNYSLFRTTRSFLFLLFSALYTTPIHLICIQKCSIRERNVHTKRRSQGGLNSEIEGIEAWREGVKLKRL